MAVIAFTPITPDATPTLRVLIFLSSLAATVLGMAVEGLMAHAITPEERGRAAGWFQAGNLGGAGIGGGIALLLAQRFSTQAAFLVTAGLMLSCTYVLRLVPEAPSIHPEGSFVTRFGKAMLEVLRDLWRMVANRKGIVGVLLVFLPIGSAAGGALFSAMADHWGASGKLVALTSGVLAGLVAMVGCLVGGWLSDRIGRRTSYITAGVILALIAVAMALTPKTPVTYVTFVLVYQFGSGIAYGTFTGFVLSVIGKGAVATKYTLMAALSNIPIMYMKYINGWAAENHGLINMLYVDALSEVLGIVALLLIIVAVRPGADEK